MRRAERHRRDAAIDASLLLVQDALVQIRTMSYLRRTVGAGASDDYHERIRLLADVCENLPAICAPARPERRHKASSTPGTKGTLSASGYARRWRATAST